MDIPASTSNKPTDAFKTYPEFSRLTLGDRKKYEALIRDYPPIADLSFFSLMVRWNTLDSCAVSTLNGNLIVSYWLPGMEKPTGLSIVGEYRLDETICQIFDQLRVKGETPRLVHVPEFVVSALEYPELFKIKPERAYDEYVVSLAQWVTLDGMLSFRRRRVQKFLKKVPQERIVVRGVDLSLPENRQRLLECVDAWKTKGVINSIALRVNETIDVAIEQAHHIGTKNLCLFIDGELYGYVLYHLPADKRYATLAHIQVRADMPYVYDYLVYAFAAWFMEQGIVYGNLDSDLGIPVLRMLKLALRPVNYFRKYTIEPAS